MKHSFLKFESLKFDSVPFVAGVTQAEADLSDAAKILAESMTLRLHWEMLVVLHVGSRVGSVLPGAATTHCLQCEIDVVSNQAAVVEGVAVVDVRRDSASVIASVRCDCGALRHVGGVIR